MESRRAARGHAARSICHRLLSERQTQLCRCQSRAGRILSRPGVDARSTSASTSRRHCSAACDNSEIVAAPCERPTNSTASGPNPNHSLWLAIDYGRNLRFKFRTFRVLSPRKHCSARAEQQAEQNRQDFCPKLHIDFTGVTKRRRY